MFWLSYELWEDRERRAPTSHYKKVTENSWLSVASGLAAGYHSLFFFLFYVPSCKFVCLRVCSLYCLFPASLALLSVHVRVPFRYCTFLMVDDWLSLWGSAVFFDVGRRLSYLIVCRCTREFSFSCVCVFVFGGLALDEISTQVDWYSPMDEQKRKRCM